jgi:hypothetical protein
MATLIASADPRTSLSQMGIHASAFKCPQCGQLMGEGSGPNWTLVPGANYGNLVVLSCTNINCQAALGAAFIPPPQQARMGQPFS